MIRNWTKGKSCYIVSESLKKVCPMPRCNEGFVSDKLVHLAEISKQSFKTGFFGVYSKM